MKKKIISLFLICSLILSCGVLVSADTDIINSMDFQGEAIELSLDKAIEITQENSYEGKTKEWNKKYAEAKYKDSFSSANMITESTSKDVYALRLLGRFLKEQLDRNYQAEKNALTKQVKEQYYGLIQLQEFAKINEENMNIRKKLHKDITTKFQLGIVAKQDVLTAEYEYLKAQSDYENALNNYNKGKMAFNIFLGYDVMQEIILTDKLENKEMIDIEIADAISKAFLNRNEIKGAEFKKELEQVNLDKVKVRYPSSSLTVVSQEIELEKAIYNYENAYNAIEIDVRSKYLDMIEKKHALEASIKSVESAEEAYRLVQLTYNAGMAVLTDVQDVQTKVLQARLGLSKAMLDYNLAVDAFENCMDVGVTVVSIV